MQIITCSKCAGSGNGPEPGQICEDCNGVGKLGPFAPPWELYLKLLNFCTIEGQWLMGEVKQITPDGVRSAFLYQFFTTVNGQKKIWQAAVPTPSFEAVDLDKIFDDLMKKLTQDVNNMKFLV